MAKIFAVFVPNSHLMANEEDLFILPRGIRMPKHKQVTATRQKKAFLGRFSSENFLHFRREQPIEASKIHKFDLNHFAIQRDNKKYH